MILRKRWIRLAERLLLSGNDVAGKGRAIAMMEKVDAQNRVAVYVQIENNFQFEITSGRLKPGTGYLWSVNYPTV